MARRLVINRQTKKNKKKDVAESSKGTAGYNDNAVSNNADNKQQVSEQSADTANTLGVHDIKD